MDRMLNWFSRDSNGNPLTAKQKKIVQDYLTKSIPKSVIQKEDHITSFFVVIWGGTWLAFAELMRLFPWINSDALGTYLAISNVVVIGFHWGFYKFAQYLDRVDYRFITRQSLSAYINTLFASFVIVTASILGVLFFQFLLPDVDSLTVLVIAFAIGGLIVGSTQAAPYNISIKMKNNILIDSKSVEHLCGFESSTKTSGYFGLLFFLTTPFSIGLVITLLGGNLTPLQTIGNPLLFLLILVFVCLTIFSGLRNYYSQIRTILTDIQKEGS
ncbi:MAG: hypothetical protein ACFFEV_00050 [Candidatus Thorarchaeota archaeon]